MVRQTQDGRSLAGGNAGDPEQVKQKGNLVELARTRRMGGWRYLLATPLGRELAWTILEDCTVFVEIFSADTAFLFANAGRQTWGLQMMAEMIEADADHYLLMQKEAIERTQHADAPKKPTEDDTDV